MFFRPHVGSFLDPFSVTEPLPKRANLFFGSTLKPPSAPFSLPEPPSDGLGTPRGAGAVSRGPGSALDRAGCSGLAGFYRKPTAPSRLHRMGWGGLGAGAYRAVRSAGADIPRPAAAAQRTVGPQPKRYEISALKTKTNALPYGTLRSGKADLEHHCIANAS